MPIIKFSHIASTYNDHLDSLYAYALHLGFDEQTAKDAIHDVFYKLCMHHSSLDEISNLKFYLFRSLRNRLIDLNRTNREHTGIYFEEEISDENLPFQLHVTLEDEFIQKEDSEEIRLKVENVLNRLSHRQREIIFLRYIQECSYDEISEIMQISVAASRNLVNRSLKRLKKAMLTLPQFLLMIS